VFYYHFYNLYKDFTDAPNKLTLSIRSKFYITPKMYFYTKPFTSRFF